MPAKSASTFKLLALVAAAGAAGGGAYWWHEQETEQEQIIAEQAAELVQKEQEIEFLQDVASRLTLEERAARIVVTEQTQTAEGVSQTTLLFFEVGPDGEEMPAREFTVLGEQVHVGGLVIRFNEEDVARGNTLTGKSIVLWDRIYGSATSPEEGQRIDPEGQVPRPYRQTPDALVAPAGKAAFEAALWQDFWLIATDPDLAETRGVKVAYGQEVYGIFEPGRVYELTLQANGGLTLYADEMPTLMREVLRAITRTSPEAVEGDAAR
jgi:hypothetical protein